GQLVEVRYACVRFGARRRGQGRVRCAVAQTRCTAGEQVHVADPELRRDDVELRSRESKRVERRRGVDRVVQKLRVRHRKRRRAASFGRGQKRSVGRLAGIDELAGVNEKGNWIDGGELELPGQIGMGTR